MFRLSSSKTAKIWAERIAQCERSNVPTAQFCQSIGCSPTSFYQWKRKLAAKHQATAFLRVQTSDSIKVSIEIKLPSGISILVPVSAVESIAAILEQIA
jgi:transposase-like protein